jgi:predicted Zn-dependent peptidase
LNDKISIEERNDAVKRMNRILDEFESTLKRAEIIYKEAVEKGDIDLQKKLLKNINKIKKEEASIQNLIAGICEISK